MYPIIVSLQAHLCQLSQISKSLPYTDQISCSHQISWTKLIKCVFQTFWPIIGFFWEKVLIFDEFLIFNWNISTLNNAFLIHLGWLLCKPPISLLLFFFLHKLTYSFLLILPLPSTSLSLENSLYDSSYPKQSYVIK